MSAAARLIPWLALAQRIIPAECLRPLAALLGKILGRAQRRRRAAVEYNLSRLGMSVTPGAGAATIRNWTLSLADQIRSLWMRRNELQRMVEDYWSANLSRALSEGRGVVLVTGHLGNYELAGSYLASFGLPVHAVVEEIADGHTAAMNRIRRRFGMGVVAYSDVRGMLRVLREGGILVLLADRNIAGKGIRVDFGGSERIVPQGPALLARRTRSLVQTGYFVLDRGRGRYVCVVNPAIRVEDKERADLEALAGKITSELVRAIRAYPDQWFVFEDEWSA